MVGYMYYLIILWYVLPASEGLRDDTVVRTGSLQDTEKGRLSNSWVDEEGEEIGSHIA